MTVDKKAALSVSRLVEKKELLKELAMAVVKVL